MVTLNLLRRLGKTEMNKQDTALPTKARFTMSYDNTVFMCEECEGIKFRKIDKVRAKCADDDCGVVYSVEYSMLDIDIIYYKG